MEIDRRAFLLALSACAIWGAAPWAGEESGLYAGAYLAPDGTHGAAVVDQAGAVLRSVPLPGRGHDATLSRVTGDCVVFARRPGNFAVAFSARQAGAAHVFTTPAGRHFYGHGIFSADGRLLFATENAFDEGTGRIGVYDAGAGYARIGEFPSYGVGPHDLALVPGQPVLVVANGGMREHPAVGGGRDVMNAGHLVPSLAYVDMRTGELLEQHRPGSPSGGLSLRHLDVAPDGTVIIGCQAEDDSAADPLIFRHRRQQDLIPVETDREPEHLFRGYVSSVAIDRSGGFAALTSSRSGMATVIDVASGRVIRCAQMTDVSGVASAIEPGAFVLTAGTGLFVVDGPQGARRTIKGTLGWDNHLARL